MDIDKYIANSKFDSMRRECGRTECRKACAAGAGRRVRELSFWLVAQPSKSAAHRDKSQEWNVSKQKWNHS